MSYLINEANELIGKAGRFFKSGTKVKASTEFVHDEATLKETLVNPKVYRISNAKKYAEEFEQHGTVEGKSFYWGHYTLRFPLPTEVY